MNEDQEPPKPAYRFKARPESPPTAPPKAADHEVPIDVRDFVPAYVPKAAAYSPPPPAGTSLDDKERALMKSLCGAALAGLFLLWQNGSAFLTSVEARTWPTAPGQIQTIKIVTEQDDDGHETYEVVAKYSYEVGGAPHTGDRLGFRDPVKHERLAAQQDTAEYWAGKQVTVHYNPRNPEVAIIDLQIYWENWLLFGFGLILTALGIGAAVMLWRARA